MRNVSPATDLGDGDAPGLGVALGVLETHDDIVLDDRETALRDTRGLWPVAAVALACVPPGIAAVAARLGQPTLASQLAAIGAAGPLVGIGVWLLLSLTPLRRIAAHRRIVLLALGCAIAAAALTLVADLAGALADPRLRVAAQVAAFGTIVLTVCAAHAVRAATLAFVAALAATVALLHGAAPPSTAAAAIALLFAVGMLSDSRRHVARLRERQGAAEAEERASRLVAEFEGHGPGWFWQTDRAGRLVYLSEKVVRQIAAFGADPLAEPLTAVFRVDSASAETERTLNFHLTSRTSFSDYSVRPAMPGAPERWWSISGRPVLDPLGRFQGFAGFGSDLTEKRRAEAEITRLALFDSLTGLANRQRMRLSLEQTLAQPHGGHGMTGLFLLDLDRFKAVNDTLGHQVGDELLKQVAQRLQQTVGDAGLVGRLGGDEFQVVLPREGNRERLGALADKVIDALSQAYYIDGATIAIGCSIGIAIAPDHGDTPETLIRNADLALYAAKGDGRGVHRVYRDELLAGAQNRKQLEDDLRLALRHEQLHLAYQPVVSTADARIVGYEALLRWDHPQRGAISPAEFIPVAEECGLIESIGEWVLRTAAAEAAHWPGHVRVAVNVSPIQFANPALPSLVTSAIAAAGLPAGRLELEITEGVFLNEDASTENMFRALKGIGVRLALDDFGTGYSSLGYLKKAPFDKIKIDQSFVRGAIQPGNRNAAIIKAIVSLADTLGMETTAEGVEQQDEIALIRDLGCSHIQGYVYGRPARGEVVRAQLAERGGMAEAVGHKTSRAPRHKVLRSARLTLGEEVGEVRVRDISTSGVLIDGIELPEAAVGYPVAIEILDDQLLAATIRWAEDGRAGLQFAMPFDLDRLNQPARVAVRRSAA
jgi:diguanylate cyclase (GGDEF)-like protein